MTQAGAFGLVLDCNDPAALAAFWTRALGYTEIGRARNYVLLMPEHGSAPKLLLQKVPEAKTVKNRMHLDIDIPDIEAEAARLERLGASRLDAGTRTEFGVSWVLMADPEGNEFCVCDGGAGSSTASG
jgi:predicted enzyme related to lactoylglutathione lyase